MRSILQISVLGLVTGAFAYAAPFSVTETTDFANSTFAPTNLGVTLDAGINTITGALSGGSLGSGGDNLDAMDFSTGGIPITAIRFIVTNFQGTTDYSVLQTGLQAAGAFFGFVEITGNGTYNLPLTQVGGDTVFFVVIRPQDISPGVFGSYNYRIEIVAGTPEPATITLLLLGCGGLLIAKRRAARLSQPWRFPSLARSATCVTHGSCRSCDCNCRISRLYRLGTRTRIDPNVSLRHE